jgi:hypothetical protein
MIKETVAFAAVSFFVSGQLTFLSFWPIMESAKKIGNAYLHEYPRGPARGYFIRLIAAFVVSV